MEKVLSPDVTMVEGRPFILMDNGSPFYLHVIGITPLTSNKLVAEDEPSQMQ